MQNMDETGCGGKSGAGRLEMASQYGVFVDSGIVEKTIGGFGRSPVLASQWNRIADAVGEILEQTAEPRSQSRIGKSGEINFLLNPILHSEPPVARG
jgi:hypothetical protein